MKELLSLTFFLHPFMNIMMRQASKICLGSYTDLFVHYRTYKASSQKIGKALMHLGPT